jgi:hypothetical protein
MHSSFDTRKGFVLAVRAGLLALRVRTFSGTIPVFGVRLLQPAFPKFPSVDDRKFLRLQLRGSAGFAPASQSHRMMRVREPNVVKEQISVDGNVLGGMGGSQLPIRPAN